VSVARLEKDPERTSMALGGTVVYRVVVDDRWIGWVGDMRLWRGWRYGGRKWWACWREDGDTAARWSSFDGRPHVTRAAAFADLLRRVVGGGAR
jgi:hypothetical protein